MLGLSLLDLWGTGLRRLLKPAELVKGVFSVYRTMLDKLDDVPLLLDSKPPASHGNISKLLTLPVGAVTDTTSNPNTGIVAGTGVTASSTNFTPPENFPYMLTGAPEGIISFSKGVDGATAYLYSEFVYVGGVYYFNKNPNNYGVITTSGEFPEISFVTVNYKDTTIAFQDRGSRFKGSGDFGVNTEIAYRDSMAGVLSAPGKLALLSCGVDTSLKPAILKHVWMEGGVVCALTDADELLLDAAGSDIPQASTVEAGMPLTGKVFSKCVVYSDVDSEQLECELDAPEAVVRYYSDNGELTLTREGNYPEYTAQNALDFRLEKLSTQYIVNLIDVTVPDTIVVGGNTASLSASDANIVYVYYASNPQKNIQPLVYRGISPRTALYGNFPEFGVLRIQLDPTNNTAITDNGQVYNRPLKCGDIIKAVTLVRNNNATAPMQTPEEDVILYHMQIPAVAVGAGGSAVFHLV